MQEEVFAILLREIGFFLGRPMTKPSHRIYALGFLNKSAPVIAQDFKARATLLSIYFNLFNKLLHQDPQESIEKVKKDRTISKKERKKQEKIALKKRGEVDDEDNKVIELVLKGVNIVLLKSGH